MVGAQTESESEIGAEFARSDEFGGPPSLGPAFTQGPPPGGGYFVPRQVNAMVDGRIFAFASAHSFSLAQARWRTDGPPALRGLEQERDRLRLLLRSAGEARSGRLFFFNPRVWIPAVWFVLEMTVVLLLIEGLSYAWLRRRRAWPGHAVA